ncbi:MAG TPA: RNA polymerase sigma factor [Steroidobacteraceae bacterium]|nr:RNA polymerase sigma factor [Steroidobacteraceae bacterium]
MKIGMRFSPDDAEDVVQDAYVRLLEYRQIREVRDEASFLSRIVANLAINHYRRQRMVTYSLEGFMALGLNDWSIEVTPEPERVLTARERLDAAAKILSHTSRRTCAIFLAHRAGFGYKEIAADFGISRRTVYKHIARATLLLGLRPPPDSRF